MHASKRSTPLTTHTIGRWKRGVGGKCGQGGKWLPKWSEVIQHSCVNQPALGNQWPHSGEWIQCGTSLVTLGLKNSRGNALFALIAHCCLRDGPARWRHHTLNFLYTSTMYFLRLNYISLLCICYLCSSI